jgi:hypothetical protein
MLQRKGKSGARKWLKIYLLQRQRENQKGDDENTTVRMGGYRQRKVGREKVRMEGTTIMCRSQQRDNLMLLIPGKTHR